MTIAHHPYNYKSKAYVFSKSCHCPTTTVNCCHCCVCVLIQIKDLKRMNIVLLTSECSSHVFSERRRVLKRATQRVIFPRGMTLWEENHFLSRTPFCLSFFCLFAVKSSNATFESEGYASISLNILFDNPGIRQIPCIYICG